MIRRSFRIGLRVGLLGGIAAGVAKIVQSRRSPSPVVESPPPSTEVAPETEWPPIQAPPTEVEAEVPTVQAEQETAAPVRKAPAKKAPAKKKAAPRTRKAAAPAVATAWIEPTGSVCPPSHPVKAKLSSRLFHLPGMFAYARTVPDRCYTTAEAAEGDGLVKAKR
ncbi:MAG TPA: hypothetical protein VM938_14595 [Acidimicrobiales bacterium]|nr:hypothetical protein [Acidimicrobiales bacterium]